jgi:hypothetical protein
MGGKIVCRMCGREGHARVWIQDVCGACWNKIDEILREKEKE